MAAPSKSLASEMMTTLVTWRNPWDTEERIEEPSNYQYKHIIGQPSGLFGITRDWLCIEYVVHIGKVAVAEVGLALIATMALVQAVAHSVLTLGVLTIYCINEDWFKKLDSASFSRDYPIFTQWMQNGGSNLFTLAWAVSALFFNIFSAYLPTEESYARMIVGKDAWRPFNYLYREEDRQFAERHTPGLLESIFNAFLGDPDEEDLPAVVPVPVQPIIAAEDGNADPTVNAGAALIQDYVLATVSQTTCQLFLDFDVDVLQFIAARAIYLCAFGSNRYLENIDFFQEREGAKIRSAIQNWREKFPHGIPNSEELALTMSDFEHFKNQPQNSQLVGPYKALRTLGSREIQGGIFVTRCYAKARKEVAKQQAAEAERAAREAAEKAARVTCFSSKAMSELLEWRGLSESSGFNWVHLGKVVATEVAMPVLFAAALVESVAYTVLTALSALLLPIDDRPFNFMAKALTSSAFTSMWTVTMLVDNLLNFSYPQIADEFEMRGFYSRILEASFIPSKRRL